MAYQPTTLQPHYEPGTTIELTEEEARVLNRWRSLMSPRPTTKEH